MGVDVSFVEIKKSDGLKDDSFLNIDEIIDSPEKTLKKMPIYSLHYPKGDVIKKSEGLIIRLLNNNYYINHLCKWDRLSSGGPLINYNNNKVIGILSEYGMDNKYNTGIFIKEPIETFKEAIRNNNNNNNKNMNMNMNMIMDMNMNDEL